MRYQPDVVKKRILWLMAFRLTTISLLMGATAFIFLKESGRLLTYPAVHVHILIVISYLITIPSLIAIRYINKTEWFINTQVAADIFIATALVYVTGGIDSIFSFFYLFVIIWSGIVLDSRGLFFTASLSSILYGAIFLQHFEYIPRLQGPLPLPRGYSGSQLLYKLSINILAFYSTAFIVRYLLGQLREAGERLKEKEIDYKALEELNNRIVHEVSSGLMTVGPDGRITSFNKAAQEITGYTLKDAYLMDVDEIFPGLSSNMDRQIAERAPRKGVNRLEMQYRNREGNFLHLGFSISPLKEGKDREISSIVNFQDLTAYKEMEEAVRQAERLSAVGKLAAGIAHEIRNPLASMSGSIEVLRREPGLSQENARLMDIILRESARLNRLIGEFLDYARPYKPSMKKVDFSQVVKDTLEVFQKGLSERDDIAVGGKIEDQMWLPCDPERLKDVLWNLLNNALQSMPSGGKITVSLRKYEEDAVLSVGDTGEGISGDEIERVFEPFFTTKTYGTGLGLAMVYRVVQAHGGIIRVDSEKGKGSVFELSIPLEDKRINESRVEGE